MLNKITLNKIAYHIFLSPLYVLFIALIGAILIATGFGLYGLFDFVFLNGWQNFFMSIGIIWGLALVSYCLDKSGI